MHASFPPRADSVAAARRFVRQAMVEIHLESLADDAALVVSELATNAVVHAGTVFEVACVHLGAAARIEVHDRHPAKELPAALPGFDPTRESNRGLLACSALASAWGVEYTRAGKTVWCRLDQADRPDRAEPAPVGAYRMDARAVRGPALVAVIGLDAEDRVGGWNADAEHLLGWTAAQVTGRPLAALRNHSTDLEAVPDLAAGRWQGETDLRHRDGHFVRVFVSRLPHDGPDGVAGLWLVVPALQRTVLEDLGGTGRPADPTAVGWAVFTRSELTRLHLDDLLSRAVQRACDAIDGDAAYIVLLDEDGGQAYVSASTGLVAAPSASPVAEGGSGRILTDRLPAVHDDLADRPTLPALAGTSMRSAVSVPLVVENRLIGQLVVASTTPGGFGNHDAIRMQQAADQLALSIESCRIAELARRHRGWLGYLADASDLLAGTLDPRMTLAMLAQLMVPRLASWCAITTVDPHDRVEFSHVWHADETRIDDLRATLAGDPPDAGDAGTEMSRGTLNGGTTLRLPLFARGRRLGVVLIGEPTGGRFDQDATELARELTRRAALTLDNALLYRDQLTASEALQASLLPARLPDVPDLEVGVAYRAAGPGQEVGGDFYDLFTVAPDRWRFTIGDVCGSGAEAAAVTGQARHVLRILGRQRRPVADAVRQLNHSVREEGGPAPFLTLVHGEITPRRDGGVRVELVAAGHPLPYLLDPSGRIDTVGSHQPLLGVLADRQYSVDVVEVSPGQSLLCVTDGVLERRRDGRMLGEDDMDDLLADCLGLSAAAMATAIQRAAVDYARLPPDDDIAVLVLRATSPTSAG
ncbi:MAG TPA: SpoIIE family protein phosphatase [Mycobacteriales bacterium]|nr:SpoIIE family protein phosphatase [Mycobacteriales bacterium]